MVDRSNAKLECTFMNSMRKLLELWDSAKKFETWDKEMHNTHSIIWVCVRVCGLCLKRNFLNELECFPLSMALAATFILYVFIADMKWLNLVSTLLFLYLFYSLNDCRRMLSSIWNKSDKKCERMIETTQLFSEMEHNFAHGNHECVYELLRLLFEPNHGTTNGMKWKCLNAAKETCQL